MCQSNVQPSVAKTKMEEYYEALHMSQLVKPGTPEELFWKKRVEELDGSFDRH